MFPKEIQFVLEENPYTVTGEGKWRYKVKLDNSEWWVVFWWKRKPTSFEVDEVKDLILHSMEVYQKSCELQKNELKVVGEPHA